jgi:hypothetical protein
LRSSIRKERRDREHRNDYEGDCDRDRIRQKRNDDKDKSSKQDLQKRYRTPPRHLSPKTNRYKLYHYFYYICVTAYIYNMYTFYFYSGLVDY